MAATARLVSSARPGFNLARVRSSGVAGGDGVQRGDAKPWCGIAIPPTMSPSQSSLFPWSKSDADCVGATKLGPAGGPCANSWALALALPHKRTKIEIQKHVETKSSNSTRSAQAGHQLMVQISNTSCACPAPFAEVWLRAAKSTRRPAALGAASPGGGSCGSRLPTAEGLAGRPM